jgi:hypothetical protein
MASFRNLSADRHPQESFRSRVPKAKSEKQGTDDFALPLHVFEWSRNDHSGSESSGLKQIADLELQNQATIRVV